MAVVSARPTVSHIMKFHGQGKRAYAELSALLPVIALLMAATLAKLGAATQFFHLSH
jgi:hypothetical protein